MATKTKKPTPKKKTPVKKRRSRKSKKSSNTKKNIFTILGILLLVVWVSFVYMLGQNQNDETDKAKVMKSIKPVKDKTLAKKKEPKPIQKSSNKEQLLKEHAEITKKNKSILLSTRSKKPKLVIIIDDVHTRSQLSAIQALKMKITPSIFPPYKLSPNSHMLAQGLKHYMIHLPMESGNKQFNKQYKTLKISFSNKKIENRIKELRILFPKAKYINNHTGSVFTSDYSSMNLAYKVMKKNGFTFIDSKTVNTSKVREIAYSYGDVYVARDIFIDNEHSVPYIHKQLKKAVNIAKRKGYAVAIGHPHDSTIKALSLAEDILKDVELIYIDGLYK